MEKRYGVKVTGTCRICGFEGKTEMHHIISQARCKKIGKDDWIKNEGNIVELCKNATTTPLHPWLSQNLARNPSLRNTAMEVWTPTTVGLFIQKERKLGNNVRGLQTQHMGYA